MNSMALDPEKVSELKSFIAMCRMSPELIHTPELKFFKDYLIEVGADVPLGGRSSSEETGSFPESKTTSGAEKVSEETKTEAPDEESESEEEEEEEEEEPQDPNVIQPETDELPPQPPQQTEEKELTDDEIATLGTLKEEAIEAVAKDDFPTALQKYTDALMLGNPTALLFCRRAEVLLKMKRPLGCIKDCTEAMKLNPDNAKCYKTRGKAYWMLGKCEEAHNDLDLGQKLDYEDDLWEMQKLVDEKFKKIDEKRRVKKRKDEEKNIKRKLREQGKRRAEAQRKYEEQNKRDEARKAAGGGMPGGFPGGMGGMPGGMGMGGMPGGMGGMPGGMGGMPGGMGGMPGGMGGMPGGMGGMPGGGGADVFNMFNDPELKGIFENPKIMKAMQEVMSDPSAMSKYQSDPEVAAAMSKLKSKFGGGVGGKPTPGSGGL